jgi:ATP-binding cassette, subfamily C, bacterial
MIKDGGVQAIGTRDEILPLIMGQRNLENPSSPRAPVLETTITDA